MIMQWLAGVFQSLFPVDRWLTAVGNLLRGLNLAFILFFFGWLALIFNDFGFSPGVRLGLIGVFVAIDVILIAIEVVLAVRGEWLYSPYERSLQSGKQFGSEERPRKRSRAMRLPKETQRPGLPPASKRR